MNSSVSSPLPLAKSFSSMILKSHFCRTGTFYVSEHNDGLFVAHFALVYEPSIPFIDRRCHSKTVDIEISYSASGSDRGGFLQDPRGNSFAAKLWFDVNGGYPRRILRSVFAVTFNDRATPDRYLVGEAHHGVRHDIVFFMRSEPIEDDLRGAVSFAPPFTVDPKPNRLHELRAFG